MLTLRHLTVLLACSAIAGCAGLSIEAISSADVDQARAGKGSVGYVVYEPVVAYQRLPGTACQTALSDGKCPEDKVVPVCLLTGPILLPNFARPYSVKPRVGLGKADINIQIRDGWMLSEVTDKSDNTAILDRLAAPKAASTREAMRGSPADPTCEGLWQWDSSGSGFKRIPLVGEAQPAPSPAGSNGSR